MLCKNSILLNENQQLLTWLRTKIPLAQQLQDFPAKDLPLRRLLRKTLHRLVNEVTKGDSMHVTKNGICTGNVRVSKRASGFSLPEILIVLVIISVILVITLPRAIQTLRAYRLDSTVSIITDKLMEARIDAIKRNRTSWLMIDRTGKTARVRTTDAAGTTIDVGYPQKFPEGVNLAGTANSINVTFDSLGRSSSGTQSFTVLESNSTLSKDMTVSPTGKITASGTHLYGG